MRHFCLVTYRKKNHHILPSGCIHLMEGMSAWNCTVKTKSVLMSNTLPFTFFFHICAVSELPRISYQSGRHIYYSCLFVACILSAGVICWGSPKSRTSCLLHFLLSGPHQHRENIPICLFFSALKLDHSTPDCVQ